MPVQKEYDDIIYTVPFYSNDIDCRKCLEYSSVAIKKNTSTLAVNVYNVKKKSRDKKRAYRNRSRKLFKKLLEMLNGKRETPSVVMLERDKLVDINFAIAQSITSGRKIKESRTYNYKRIKEGLEYVQNIQRQVSVDETSP
jgi:hypothetical protein